MTGHLVGVLAASRAPLELLLLAIGPSGGAAVFFGIFRYYRNTDKSHAFERETRVSADPVVSSDVKIGEVKGTRKTRIDGDNSTSHRKRVQRVE